MSEFLGFIFGIGLGALALSLLVRLLLKPAQPKSRRGRVVECGDLKGVTMVSTDSGTVVKQGDRVVHQSDASGVQIHFDESGVKKIRNLR